MAVTPVSLFQSTRPVKGATRWQHRLRHHRAVSIHAPREGRDGGTRPSRTAFSAFQSTRPVKGATSPSPSPPNAATVSIHAPREGRDDSAASSGCA